MQVDWIVFGLQFGLENCKVVDFSEKKKTLETKNYTNPNGYALLSFPKRCYVIDLSKITNYIHI